MRSSRFWIALTGAAALLALALVARSADVRLPDTPDTLLDFAHTFPDIDGREVSLEEFRGKPLVINFWATWCGPCRLEMPQLVALSAKFRSQGLTIVGISIDDTPEQIRAFAADYGVNYPMLVGRGRDASLMALGYEDALPTSVFVRADGTVTHRLRGLATTQSWERRIQTLF